MGSAQNSICSLTPSYKKGTTMKANKTARRKAARKAKLRKMRLRVGKILKKKKNGHLTST
jgi:hypothetical protein